MQKMNEGKAIFWDSAKEPEFIALSTLKPRISNEIRHQRFNRIWKW